MLDSPAKLLRLSGVLFGLFLVLTALVVAGWTQSFDDQVADIMRHAKVSWLVSAAEVFHFAGRIPLVLVLVAVGFVVLAFGKQLRAAFIWLGIVTVAAVFSDLTKALVGRDRPVDALVQEHSFSYPSGHSMVAAAAIGLGLAIVASILWPQRRRLFLWTGWVFAVLMVLSRIYLRAHWLTDTLGGLLFGTAIVVASVAFWLRNTHPPPASGSP
ncbi:MAG: phosphatase PAP2 family protein [Acidimicrobiia bacterium]|nr:phosphatase PAP2 family protein [Acidimicrobiia bacterium]